MTEEQIKEVEKRAAFYMATYDVWREGQAFFNALYDLYPEIANEIRATKYDMFCVDANIKRFKKKYLK